MADFSAIDELMGQKAMAPAPTTRQRVGDTISSGFETLWEGGTGALMAFLDTLDRPRRALAHGLRGDWRQAAEAFDPFNLITPDVESRPIGVADLMGEAGIGEGFQTGLGSARAVAGFVGDVLLDPLTYFGAPLARGVGAALKRGKPLVTYPAGQLAALNRAVASSRLPVIGTMARRAESVAGGIQSIGNTLGDAFIKDYRLRRFLTPEAAADHVARRQTWLSEIESKTAQGQAIGAKIERDLTAEESARLLDFKATPTFNEEYLKAEFGANPIPYGEPAANQAAIARLMEKKILPAGGVEEAVRSVRADPRLNASMRQMLTGDPAFAQQRFRLPGHRGAGGQVEAATLVPSGKLDLSDIPEVVQNLGTQGELQVLNHLQQANIDRSMARLGAAYVGHVGTKDEAARALLSELRQAVPGLTEADPFLAVKKARDFAARTKDALAADRVRTITGVLSEIEGELGPLFTRRAGEEFAGFAKRYATITSVDGMVRETLLDPRVGMVSKEKIAQLPAGFKHLSLDDLPRSIRNRLEAQGTPHVAMHAAVAEDIFGKGGFLARLERFTKADGVLGLLQGFNRYYKPWTLAHPATASRDLIGDLTLNAAAGVMPQWYAKAVPVWRAMSKLMRGEAVPKGSMAGKTYAEWAKELVDSGLPGNALNHTEFYGQQMAALHGGKLRRAIALDPSQNTWVRGIGALRGHISDLSRIAHYMQRRASLGWDMEKAVLSAKKHLYDVSELTNYEFSTMREVFPWYAWMRQNIPNMIGKTLKGTPMGKGQFFGPNVPLIIGRVKINADAQGRVDVPNEVLPEWIQGQLTVPVGRKDGKLSLFAMNQWIPLADLTDVDSVEKFVSTVVNQANPLIQTPLKLVYNWDLFFKRATERYDGQREHFLGVPINRKTAQILRVARLLNELDRTVGPMVEKLAEQMTGRPVGYFTGTERMQDMLAQSEWSDLILRATAGVKIREVDLVRAKLSLAKRTRREIAELKGEKSFARKDQDYANMAQVDRLIAKKRALLQTLSGFDPRRNPYTAGLLTDAE